ncbi:MAG: UDP-N-acetylmuramoyl-L-alanine--D-glutamate ligase [Lachnospiraceae bacterium]|nr:UDP-N-acetylmuramoyl-L-alanine--D-glutamate ligase [Lachnospiraceae bacterium]
MKMATYLVVGSGISGVYLSRMLLSTGNEVLLYDGNEKLIPENIKEKVMKDFEGGASYEAALKVYVGALTAEILDATDICVISPGVPVKAPFLDAVREKNIPVTGEVELSYSFAKGKLAAITGTNGKTTTTALTGEILSAFYPETYTLGNIGLPYASAAAKMTENAATVIEISSFMMETAGEFHPNVSAILNITPDHLDRHGSMECYIAMKERIAMNQTMDDTCVLNYEDPVLREFGVKLKLEKKCKVVFFSSKTELENGYFVKDEVFYKAKNGEAERLMHADDMNLLGVHNYENVCAAIAVTSAMGVPMDVIIRVVKSFKAVEHRIEFVREIGGVKYYNDSKGTNPDAAIQAVKAMKGPTVLIGGGYDKHSEYDEWIKAFGGKVKKLVLIGQTKEKIAETCEKLGFKDYEFAESFKEAFDKCVAAAGPGDNVLLSPACASWGMFDNYEQRGRIFKDMVNEL